MKRLTQISILLATGLVGCGKAPKHIAANASGSTQSAQESAASDPEDADSKAKAMLTCSVTDGKAYSGFGNVNLVAGRITEVAKEGDRFRVKPYSVLAGEFTRVMGAVPASLTANAASFPQAADRYYAEPQASAIILFTNYRVSYEAGLTLAGSDPRFAAAPTQDSATANCTTFARQAWNRLPTSEEVAACTKVAMVDTAAETDIKARWAYTLASVLTATGFVAY